MTALGLNPALSGNMTMLAIYQPIIILFDTMIKSNRTRNRKLKEERDLVNNLFLLDQGIKSDTSLVNSSQAFHLNNKSQEIDDAPKTQTIDNGNSLVLDTHTTTLPNFDDGLAHWAVNHNIPMTTVNSLLLLLRTHKCFSPLPKDSRTLSKYDYSLRSVEPSLYYHFGIAKGIFQNYVVNEDHFSIKIHFYNNLYFLVNKELVSDSESKDDSDFDPDFTLHIDLFASFKTSEMETLSRSQCNIPSKRKLFNDFQEVLELNDFSEKSCFEQQNSDDFSSDLTLKTSSSTASNQGLTLSNRKTGIEPTMSLFEIQKYVVNILSTIKYDLNCCVSTNQQINANMNTLLETLNKNAVTSDDGFNDYDLNDIFPIESLEALQEFEFKLQRNENNFKTIMVRKLSLFVTNKSVGDSMRLVLLFRMFDDKVLENYSTYGFKKNLKFSSL
ncbi:DUF4806 domain-containing protein [Aphis craccivora]|uniref:DUF4806 domain-containing protein n=1 Tax=Aphis craccivora TaxID=307492 RepID=A0A6G0YVY4_APHCR|nr:DUF4806 domain-containing protein [Aphis craccivora]